MAKAGEAYGFLKYGGNAADIADNLRAVRNSALTPPETLLTVSEGIENLSMTGDSELVHIAQRAERAGMTHVLKAALPFTDNKGTVTEVSAVVNQLYQNLHQQGEQFCGEIAYRQGNKYVFAE